jgi:cell division protein FtsN
MTANKSLHDKAGVERMSTKWWMMALIIIGLPIVSSAQSNSDSATYRRAQTLVNDGNAAAGRAIVDSMIARATPGTNEYAEGLYWRAVLSATAADAEMDYRRIIVDHPLSPRVEEVFLRLAQLELARADYDGALQHLNRLMLEHPTGSTRARAGYWTARVLFEKNDTQRACAANADALVRTSPEDTELRNQILYLNQRCSGITLNVAPISNRASDSALKSKPDTALSVPAAVPQGVPAVVQPSVAAQKPPMQLPTSPKDGKPTMIDSEKRDRLSVTKAASSKGTAPTTSVGSPAESGEYSVQVAAYNLKSQAEAMATKMRKRGYETRVAGASAPFRVRIGRYATQAQASAVMRSLKAKQIDGFVVKAEQR